ncbi:hypothetical protein GWI33_005595 [Rhynchophorus ferrugineus]|uniref:Uncharacterized protein n=1 Tax=Rhynchophorus ferrugineus TaxID=354439 RepID=A0A834IH20_RHYFE|nr:hypothetical protein GWI33_005595 [Rhynchophorus ferrugineus]
MSSDQIPQWKKDLIARLRSQNKKNEERLWIDHHTPHSVHTNSHPKPELCPSSPDTNSCDKNGQSAESSDSEDLHYGPGIVNRLKNKYLSLALRESNNRPSILRKATSLENLLDDDDAEDLEKEDGRLFRRRGGGKDGGSHYNHYRGNRRQDIKRARSVETISRISHDEELTMTSSVTAKINSRQSLHEDKLMASNEKNDHILDAIRPPPHSPSYEHEGSNKLNGNRPHRTWWKSPLLDENEKPPADVVRQKKMIFEKRPEQRTKKPPQTGDVAAKVDSFNNIIVKAKVASKSKPPVKHVKPVQIDKPKNNMQNNHRPMTKPVIINENATKPKSLDLNGSKKTKKDFHSLPSPIPDVSRVDINQDVSDSRNNTKGHLCETPDLILTSTPLPKITSPTYRKTTTESFIAEERNSGYLGHTEATNRYVSPIHSPKYHTHDDRLDSPGVKAISPLSQNNITKNSASAVFNFVNSQVDQKHLPPVVNQNVSDNKVPISEPLNIEVNGHQLYQAGNRTKRSLSAFEIEKNHKNSLKSAPSDDQSPEVSTEVEDRSPVRKIAEKDTTEIKNVDISASGDSCSDNLIVTGDSGKRNGPEPVEDNRNGLRTAPKPPERVTKDAVVERVTLKPVSGIGSTKTKQQPANEENPIKIVFPKKQKARVEESTTSVFNFTTRKDVPDYIANDRSRAPSMPAIPKPDESGIKILSESVLLANFKEIQGALEEDELIRNLEARPPSPCDVVFINDNILIDGKSSLIQNNSKKGKLKISFIDDAEIYEYPSETSLLIEDSPLPSPLDSATVGHSIPSLSGSSLATYVPKNIEDFELGVTKTPPPPPPRPDVTEVQETTDVLEEIEKPILFSSGGSTDMLF